MLNIQQIIINLGNSIGSLHSLVVGITFVIGMMFIFRALYHLKIYGELRTMMASQTGLKEPMAYIFVGAVFLWLPTGFSMVMQTTFGYDNPLAYSEWQGSFANSISGPSGTAFLRLIQFVGLIAFVRGWMTLVKLATSQGAAQGQSYGKGLTHILGGVLAMNIVGTANVVWNTFGESVG